MNDYWTMRNLLVKFINESGMSAFDISRIAKDLCCCRTCKFFVQHYTKDGTAVDFGHCRKDNIPRSKRPNMESCGYWTLDEGDQS